MLLREAIMLHAMHYFMKQGMTINYATVQQPPKDDDPRPAPLISSKSLNRQVIHSILIQICENTKSVLEGLERQMLSRGTPSWAGSFGVMLILCLCIEEIPATISSVNEAFPLRDDLEQERVKIFKIYADLENHPFHLATTVFHQTYRRLNPLKDDWIPNTSSGWGKKETTFLTEIRQIIVDHGEDCCSKPRRCILTHLIPRNWPSKTIVLR
jgi:hypothetical protein